MNVLVNAKFQHRQVDMKGLMLYEREKRRTRAMLNASSSSWQQKACQC